MATGTKQNIDLLANLKVAGSSVLGATIMRTHCSLSFSEASADTGQGVIAGFIVSDAPTTVNLDPSTQFGLDWMLLRPLGPSGTGNEIVIGTTLFWGHTIDLRSKRKIEELGEQYLLCLFNNGSGTVSVSRFTRTLIALP